LGLFKSIVKVARKPAAALLGGSMMTGLISKVAPKLLGIKSPAAKAIVAKTQLTMAAIGGASVGGMAASKANANMSYEQWLASVNKKVQPFVSTMTQQQIQQVAYATKTGGVTNGADSGGYAVGGGGGLSVPVPSGRQGRRPVRRGRGRCWTSHGRRYCYR
jgi:hypothetical protein